MSDTLVTAFGLLTGGIPLRRQHHHHHHHHHHHARAPRQQHSRPMSQFRFVT